METEIALGVRANVSAQLAEAADLALEEKLSRLDVWWGKVCIPLLALSLGSFLATILAFAYFPSYVGLQVLGAVNVAYLLALLQFAITFVVAVTYSISAERTADPLRQSIRTELELRPGAHDA